MKSDRIDNALRSLQKQGLLLPERVVAAAQPEDSPLHSCFEWDDNEAAHQHRLWQARQLIRTRVILIEGIKEPITAYVSLKSDRKDGAGYRSIVTILQTPRLRKQMLEEALEELQTFQQKYRELTELVEVFDAAKRVRKKAA